MNPLLKKYFTEEEFVELRDGLTVIENKNVYSDSGCIKNTNRKSLGKPNGVPIEINKTKKYPGGPLVDDDSERREIEDEIVLKHTKLGEEHLWIICLNINRYISGYFPYSHTYSFKPMKRWTKTMIEEGREVFFGVGDTYGELKPLSKSKANKKLKISPGDVFIHINNDNCLYVKDELGMKGFGYNCEIWNFHHWSAGYNDVIKTPVVVSKHPVQYSNEIIMSDKEIKDQYLFLMKSKEGSTDLEDYFGIFGKTS